MNKDHSETQLGEVVEPQVGDNKVTRLGVWAVVVGGVFVVALLILAPPFVGQTDPEVNDPYNDALTMHNTDEIDNDLQALERDIVGYEQEIREEDLNNTEMEALNDMEITPQQNENLVEESFEDRALGGVSTTEKVDANELMSDLQSLEGDQVEVVFDSATVFSNRGIIVSTTNNDSSVLVLSPTTLVDEGIYDNNNDVAFPDRNLRVMGEVGVFNLTEYEDRYGLDLEYDLYDDLKGEYFIDANTITYE